MVSGIASGGRRGSLPSPGRLIWGRRSEKFGDGEAKNLGTGKKGKRGEKRKEAGEREGRRRRRKKGTEGKGNERRGRQRREGGKGRKGGERGKEREGNVMKKLTK